jgi:flagellum-specific ATP synthase
MAVYAEAEDLINVGAYHQGSNPAIDEAIAKHGPIEDFLIQSVEERSPLEETLAAMSEITGVEISSDEMTDGASQPSAVSGGRKKAPQEAGKAVSAEDAARALNSVAALFSMTQGA